MAQEAYEHRPAAPCSSSLAFRRHPTYHDGSSSLPEVVDRSQGNNLRFAQASSDPGKEVKRPDEKEKTEDLAYGLPMSQNGYHTSGEAFEAQKSQQNVSSRERSFRILRRVCAVVVVVIVLALALGLGLGLGLKSHK
jgi:ABC-type sugar transport system permease subunit